MCGESWDINDAMVACRQLNCGRAHTITTTDVYGQGTGQTWIDQIECNGMESTLNQCPQRPFRDSTCNVSSVAGVVCTGKRKPIQKMLKDIVPFVVLDIRHKNFLIQFFCSFVKGIVVFL